MIRWLRILFGTLRSCLRTHRELALENLARRQQLAVWMIVALAALVMLAALLVLLYVPAAVAMLLPRPGAITSVVLAVSVAIVAALIEPRLHGGQKTALWVGT